ncbi:MAG: type III-A CRISPR-associated RAMP protein Csm5 [Rhodoferax sp.]|nr:type III-A CRISPR-associated RAMP protein Csm5 [Rhodoferax sp.]
MNTFLKTYRLALTPLSPIHIGCGEDFEPTNYVIDDGVLYGFDPSRAVLSSTQLTNLARVADGTDILAIQRFFKSNAKTFKEIADTKIPVCAGINTEYADLGKPANRETSGKKVANQFFIERHEQTGKGRLPYIPGSSFKGAVRTAILDALNGGKKPTQQDIDHKGKLHVDWMEKRLLGGGEFATSPLRLVKISDFMPAPDLKRKVLYSRNLKKEAVKDGQGKLRESKGVTLRKECIQPSQFRVLRADCTLPQLGSQIKASITPRVDLRSTDFLELGKLVTNYHLPRFQAELELLNRREFVNPDWSKSIAQLINHDIKDKLETGEVFLVRLGRYGGAESKTLSGEGVAQISIMQGQGQRPIFQSTTKTVWLAGEQSDAQKHLLPFGWALVEVDPETNDAMIEKWCKTWNSRSGETVEGSTPLPVSQPKVEPTSWSSARIKFNTKNGTLSAERDGIQAHAIAPRGEELLSALPAATQIKVRRNEFVKLKAWVVGTELMKVEP